MLKVVITFRMFRMAGDVWGEYNQEGVRFTLLTRDKIGSYQVTCPGKEM